MAPHPRWPLDWQITGAFIQLLEILWKCCKEESHLREEKSGGAYLLGSSMFPFSCSVFPFGVLVPFRPLDSRTGIQISYPEVWGWILLHKSSIGEVTTKKEKKGIWESERGDDSFIPNQSSFHSLTELSKPCGASTLSMREINALQRRKACPWDLRIWLMRKHKGIKELRPAVRCGYGVKWKREVRS